MCFSLFASLVPLCGVFRRVLCVVCCLCVSVRLLLISPYNAESKQHNTERHHHGGSIDINTHKGILHTDAFDKRDSARACCTTRVFGIS